LRLRGIATVLPAVRKIAAQVTLRARFFRSIGAAKKAWDKS
jgi:hypothetical protein